MANTRMVNITNMVNKTVGVKKMEYGVNRKWTKKGQSIPVPYDVVEQLLWTEGFRNMIDRGILYIESLKDKIDLGLEPDGATEPENIIVLNSKQIDNLLRNVPFVAFKKEVENLNEIQLKEIANYAIANKIADAEKSAYLYDLVQVDILKTISRNLEIERLEAKE